jgi:peptidoglycan hydrolase-like protein with peptidoglycan-binding domain
MPSTTPVHLIYPAVLPVGEVLSIDAGDGVLVAVAGPGSGPHRGVVDGHPALLLDAPFAYMTTTTPPAPLTSNIAVAAAVFRMPEVAPARFVWRHHGPLGLHDGPPRAEMFGVTVPVGPEWIDTDTHAWVLHCDGTTATLVRDGEVVGSASGATAPATGSVSVESANGGVLFYAAVWQEDVTLANAQSLAGDLLAQFGPASGLPPAAGRWSIDATASLSVGVLYEPPVVPAPYPGGAQTPPPDPEPQAPPIGVPTPVVRRYSETMPAPVLDERGMPVDWYPVEVVDEPWATLQLVVEGVDVTYFGGVATPFPSWQRGEPFGSSTAELRFPQITAFHVLPAWCVKGASVAVLLHPVVGGPTVRAFDGTVDKFGHAEDDGVFTVTARGPVYVADLQLRPPAFLPAPRDVGHVIADAINGAVSRRTEPMAAVTTGCQTTVLGAWEPRITGYVQRLLATAVTDGRQWTLACDARTPELRLKDVDTIAWRVSNGQRGVLVDLEQDWSQAPNVIYGEGVSPSGGRWRNAMYPGWRPDSTPLFPMAPSRFFTVGTRDGQTTTGRGVSDWQARVGQPVTGRFSQADRARAFQVQRAAGIQQDGTVGPQTWAASFGTGSNTGTLECFIMPLAFAPQVMPRLYGPDGDDLGPNPQYDPAIVRVEDKTDFGQNVTKTEGRQNAAETLARVIDPGWSGRVTFEIDPQEMSRYELREGTNGLIRNYRGTDLRVHVAYLEADQDRVVATVDTNARDYPTLDAIRTRERNATDPAKSIIRRLAKADVTEARATFDDESPAGHLPRHALFPNLWTVVPVPFGVYGSIVRTEITTTSAASPFALAVFNQPITPARLLALVGNPLADREWNPWDTAADALADAGLVMAWGWDRQPCGYYPQSFSTPDGEDAPPVTGRMLDDARWEYATERAPWLWVASIASSGCLIEGRFWPGAD